MPTDKWQEFKDNNDPYALGLSAWHTYDGPNAPLSAECFKVDAIPTTAEEIDGQPVSAQHQGRAGWAIQKKKGPWLGLYDWSDHAVGTGQICVNGGENLVNYFNNDAIVQQHIADLPGTPGPLACPNGTLYPINYPGTSNAMRVGCTWEELILQIPEYQDDGTIDAVEVVEYVLICREGGDGDEWPTLPSTLADIDGFQFNKWSGDEGNVLGVSVPKPPADGGPIDPKLIPIEKTLLEPGLYELVIFMKDGRTIRHFDEIKEPVVLRASFDSFVQTNIYPVPVKEQHFAIDFDLLAPLTVNMTIVNNQGQPYYAKLLAFEIAGRNKHVVKMDTQWPKGLYHLLLTYSNGTTGSRSFLVDY